MALACGACGPAREAEPARLRQTERSAALRELQPAPSTPVVEVDFSALPEGWHFISNTRDVLAADASLLETALGQEGERTFLTLSGRGGALYQVLPIEGGVPYEFRGTLRARDVVTDADPFMGAMFWVAESSKSGSLRELFGDGKRFDHLHKLPGAFGKNGWQEIRVVFRARSETKTLITGCVLAVDQTVGGGAVDFDALSVRRVDERVLWTFEAERAAGDHSRSLQAMLGGEVRPAFLCLPGESLTLEVTVPKREPVLRVGLGPWTRTFHAGREPLVHWVRVEGDELLRSSRSPVAAVECSWDDVALALAPYAGKRVRLELGLEGPMPGVFGAPVIVERAARTSIPNLLFLSIDTLRAGELGAYGARASVTPRLDALARESLVFTDMSANAPYTLPAHATLFSGQYPSVHAVEDRGRKLDPERSPILARILAGHGYATQAFAAGGFLTSDFGFEQGFDGFSILDPLRHPGSRYFEDFRREYPDQRSFAPGETGLERVRHWLGTHAGEPFFLFVHTYEVHDYDPPPGTLECAARGCPSTLSDFRELLFPRVPQSFPGTSADREHLSHLYRTALRHVDGQIGLLLDELARLGLDQRTLVVVTSDHGEEWFERGRLQHGKSLYQELLRIPWILRIPGRAPGRIETPAMQVDVLPTLLGALGLTSEPRAQGLDLLRVTPEDRAVWAEVNDHFARKSSLRLGPWKLLHGPTDAAVTIPNEREWELYDLAGDAGERRDRYADESARVAALQRELESFSARLRAERDALGTLGADHALDPRTENLLEHLGYGGTADKE